jgi:hypothetical protein
MSNVYTLSAVNCGGTGTEFEQTVYINAAGWGAADPKQRRGAMVAGTGHRGGVCMGLSFVYLASRGSWSVFKNTIASPGGLAFVRGVMNLSKEADRVGGYQNNDHRAQMMLEMGRTLGLNPGWSRYRNNSHELGARILNHVLNTPGFYHFNFWGGGGGHAVGFIGGSSYTMFDPNYGQATIGDAAQFRRFVEWVFPALYPGMNDLSLILKFT